MILNTPHKTNVKKIHKTLIDTLKFGSKIKVYGSVSKMKKTMMTDS